MNGRIGRLLALGLVLLALVSGCGGEPPSETPTTKSATPTVTASPTKIPTVTPTTPKPSPITTKKYVTDDEVRFRASPSTDAEIFQTLMKGTEVQARQVEGEWTKVTFEGQTGYIFSLYLSGTAPTP